MSFWSKIGLADKDAINKLQEEIASLREENQRLAENKEILLKSYIDEQTKNILEAIRNHGDAMNTEIIQQCDNATVSCRKSIDELKALLNEMNSKLLSSINSLDGLTSEAINGLGDSKEGITQLIKLSSRLREETSAIDKEIQTEVEKLGEAIVNLWKIMKVVFIESALGEIDKL